MAEWYSNNHHHDGPHLHKMFNCHDHKMSKSTCSYIVRQTRDRSPVPLLSTGVTLWNLLNLPELQCSIC